MLVIKIKWKGTICKTFVSQILFLSSPTTSTKQEEILCTFPPAKNANFYICFTDFVIGPFSSPSGFSITSYKLLMVYVREHMLPLASLRWFFPQTRLRKVVVYVIPLFSSSFPFISVILDFIIMQCIFRDSDTSNVTREVMQLLFLDK